MAPPVRIDSKTFGEFEVIAARQGNEFIGEVHGPGGIRVRITKPTLAHLWNALLAEVGRLGPEYVGFVGAIDRFRYFFRGGFESPSFNKPKGECGYKREARKMLLEGLPLERAVDAKGAGLTVLNVFRATDLVDPRWERPKVEALLTGADGDSFVHCAARFAQDPSVDTLRAVESVLRKNEIAKWTVLTYLPFLWEPSRHMFLKPDVMKKFASRVGHPFAFEYESSLNMTVYECLLDLAAVTEREIAAVRPRDRIDIQSFIWVVGSYDKKKHMPQD